MNGFTNFLNKAAELYLAAPLFFNWFAAFLVTLVGGLLWLSYWLGGKFSQAEISGLKAQIAALEQRFNLAKEQAAISVQEGEALKKKVDVLHYQIEHKAPILELRNSTAVVDSNMNRMLAANTAVTETLGMVSIGIARQSG
jgi:hypothetical protein